MPAITPSETQCRLSLENKKINTKGCMKYVGVGIVTLLISLKYYVYLSFADLINLSFGSTSVIVRICDTQTIHIHNCAGQGMPKLWLKNRFGL